MTTKPERLKGFACYHGDDQVQTMEALRREICETLECEPDRLVTAVVYDLNWTHNVTITGIPCDMWSAVKSEYVRHVTDEEYDALPDDAPSADEWITVADAYIQCDRIEDGFALTWKTWVEYFAREKKA